MKPGYLKTPSKRSVVRAKRPDLHASPAKQDRVGVMSPVRRLGAMSAPPAQRSQTLFASRAPGVAETMEEKPDGGGSAQQGEAGGVKSFQTRLREGGFGRSLATGVTAGNTPTTTAFPTATQGGARGKGAGNARGRTRFGFGAGAGEASHLRGGESLR